MRRSVLLILTLLFSFNFNSPSASAATISFLTDPFAGSTALTTPGRQIVGGEPFVTFDPAIDVLEFDLNFFAIGDPITFVNDVVGNIPPGGVDFIVLRTFDNDADPLTPFGAGNAANLIAAQITSPGAGLFIYFNSGLDLARLVYSTNLDDNTADLKILARFVNLTGAAGRAELARITAGNVAIAQVPEPSGLLLMTLAGVLAATRYRWSKRL